MLRNSFLIARFKTPKIIGLIHEEKEVNNIKIHCAIGEIEILHPNTKNNTIINGIQQMQNPRTAANRTREVFISCAVTVPGLLACRREGTMAVLCRLTTR